MSYIDYDEFGIVAVRCMKCGETVAIRSYRPMTSNEDPTKEIQVMTVQRLSNWRQGRRIEVYTAEGKEEKYRGYIEPILCKACVSLPLDEKDILEKAKRSWKSKYERLGLDEKEADKKMNEFHGRLQVKEGR